MPVWYALLACSTWNQQTAVGPEQFSGRDEQHPAHAHGQPASDTCSQMPRVFYSNHPLPIYGAITVQCQVPTTRLAQHRSISNDHTPYKEIYAAHDAQLDTAASLDTMTWIVGPVALSQTCMPQPCLLIQTMHLSYSMPYTMRGSWPIAAGPRPLYPLLPSACVRSCCFTQPLGRCHPSVNPANPPKNNARSRCRCSVHHWSSHDSPLFTSMLRL